MIPRAMFIPCLSVAEGEETSTPYINQNQSFFFVFSSSEHKRTPPPPGILKIAIFGQKNQVIFGQNHWIFGQALEKIFRQLTSAPLNETGPVRLCFRVVKLRNHFVFRYRQIGNQKKIDFEHVKISPRTNDKGSNIRPHFLTPNYFGKEVVFR